MSRVLVTGAAGMLGHRVVDVARERGHDATATDIDDLDLLDADAVRARIAELRPAIIVNCAAYTDVDGAEAHEETALRVNRDTVANVAFAAAEIGAFVVHVSTDYVFPGDATEPYAEDAEPGPRTAYGRTKLAGEEVLQASDADHAICRTAWLYGAGGKNFVDTMLALGADRDEVSVVFDQVGCPTWTGHLAPALLEIGEKRLAGLHHATGSGQCSWHELAIATFDEAGLDMRVVAVTSDEFRRPAPRPAYSVLGQTRSDAVRLPDWREGLRGHLSERKAAIS